ncbi:hypothetical protein BGZ47_007723 [Haplosporangium gracile]|nr:hypothetical protein BGZ47_007723 [Haplosporangium gracile]
MFRRLLTNRKTDTLAPDGGKSFAQLESGIPTFSLENLDTFFSYIRSPIGSFSSVLEALIHFYREPWFRRNRWESKKAQVAALDYAVESILNMAQRTITTKDSNNVEKKETIKGSTWGLDKRLPPIVVCIGLAKFNSRTGLPSKHGVLIKRFVQKARPLGIIIVGANDRVSLSVASQITEAELPTFHSLKAFCLTMSVYRPLVVTALLEGCPLQESNSVATMRMNLLASSGDDPRVLFVVNDDKILVYRFSTLTPSTLPTLVDRISDPRSTDEDESMDRTINAMQVGYLGTEEVLVTANDAGEVCVCVTESAWGIAIHTERRLIAISTNAHTVTVFHCGTNSRISPRHYFTTAATSTPLTATDEPTTSQQILSGHGHNIPCVTFSPCGHFVATASVDRTCRTWRLSDGQQIQQKALGPLWGWGVRFVPKESWMTITRAEYRCIPKDHLRPGKHPGLNVRDSPFSTSAFSHRRLPPGRDLRMIRTRWYAGPIHENRARRRGRGEGGATRNRTAGQDTQDNETDDRDGALFGMDDDEDEWENTSSSDMDELDGQGENSDVSQQQQPLIRSATSRQNAGSGSSTNQSPTTNPRPSVPSLASVEVSVDTGDDGDNEGTGMDTEDAAGTAGESGSSASRVGRERKLERRSLLSMKALETQHSRDQGESSSEQEQTSCKVPETSSEAAPEPIHVEPQSEEEFQPVTTSTFRNRGAFTNLVRVTPFQRVKISTTPTPSPLATSTPPQEVPTELLLCATARNIYLLGRHPLASEVPQEQEPILPALMPYSTEVTSITLLDDADEDDADEMALTGDVATNGGWYEEQEEEDSDNSSTDHHHHHHGHEDDTDDSDDSDGSESNDGTGSHSHHGSGIASLHTLTVARSAATRADGRRYHHLEHFDRLIVMELVPELSILIAASQKGTVTIFRLLRVLDDLATPGTTAGALVSSESTVTATAKASRNSQDAAIHRDKRHKGKEKQDKDKEKQDKDKEKQDKDKNKTMTIESVNYVLFPEMYLPGLEPPPLPLYGVSVVPLQRSKPSPPRNGTAGTRSAAAGTPTPTSFILHLMYMDSQLFSYELRLRNDRDDPVRLCNIFI